MRRAFIILLLVGLGLTWTRPLPVSAATPAEWPTALALMNDGQTHAALPLLERLVSAHPADKNYRFELALALFRLGRDARAQWHLEQVRGADLTTAEAALVTRYLNEIAARKVWSGHIGFAVKPESNVSRQTDATNVAIGGLNFALTPGSRGKPGTSVIVTAGLGYSPRINDRLKGVFSLDAYLRHNKDRTLRDYQLQARSGLEFFPDARRRIAAGTLVGYRWIADSAYSASGGLWGSYTQLIGSRGRLDLGVEATGTRHDIALPDSQRYLLSASYAHAIGGNAQVTVSGLVERTDSALANLAGRRAGVSIAGLYAWRGGLMTNLRLGHYRDNRRGPEPVFAVTRQDRNTSVDLSIYHRDFRIGNFAPQLLIGVERNRSNIALTDYDNRYLSLGLTRNF